jgi:hypothetical protein
MSEIAQPENYQEPALLGSGCNPRCLVTKTCCYFINLMMVLSRYSVDDVLDPFRKSPVLQEVQGIYGWVLNSRV